MRYKTEVAAAKLGADRAYETYKRVAGGAGNPIVYDALMTDALAALGSIELARDGYDPDRVPALKYLFRWVREWGALNAARVLLIGVRHEH